MNWFILFLLTSYVLWKFPLENYAPLTLEAGKQLLVALRNETLENWFEFVDRYYAFYEFLESDRSINNGQFRPEY